MAFAGVELVDQFRPVLLGFAVLLLYSSFGILTARDTDADEDINDNAVVKVVMPFCSWIRLSHNQWFPIPDFCLLLVQICRRFLTVGDQYDGSNFFTMQNGVRVATPLLLVLAVIELSDVVFAVDSIPAIFGVTLDPFIVYTSNM
jgi:predicted tellurium resistance membrane protein TerC